MKPARKLRRKSVPVVPLDEYTNDRRKENLARSFEEASRQTLTSDAGNAERFAQDWIGQAKYVADWGRWIVWTGKRWEPDTTHRVVEWSQITAKRIFQEAFDATDSDLAQALGKWGARSLNYTRLQAMLRLAQSNPMLSTTSENLNRDKWLLNCDSGTIDLRTGKQKEHDPADLITKLSPVAFDLKAQCPGFERFLKMIFRDDELPAYLQRAFGYTMSGSTAEQCLFFCHGDGQNGKSTLLEIIGHILADYGKAVASDTFMQKKYGGIPNDIAALQKVRFVRAPETEEGKHLQESLVKSVTGGDKISARFMRAEYFEFTPEFKLWLHGNHKPQVKGMDKGIRRRLKLVPFVVEIPEKDRQKDFHLKLIAEEAPGILAWLVKGALLYQSAGGLGEPATILEATEEFFREQDTVGTYVEERCTTGPDCQVLKSTLYNQFREWAETNHETVLEKRAFGERIRLKGFESYRSNGLHYWRGVKTKA